MNYKFHDKLIFRTPAIPFNLKEVSNEQFLIFTKQDFFKEAIYLASPVLYTELLKWHSGELTNAKELDKLIISLYKYYSRMQSRCTPYGLFAGCSVAQWGEHTDIVLEDKNHRHTRLDMNYLCALAQQLNTHAEIIPLLEFYPNNSIYAIGEQLRYVEYKYVNNRRLHQLTSVSNSEYLQKVLKKATKGAKMNTLASLLVDEEIGFEEAEQFIKELISSQVLVSELEPAVTGDEFIYQVIQTLQKVAKQQPLEEVDNIISLLQKIQQQIANIDNNIHNDVSAYRDIMEQLKVLNTPIEENQLFQTDLYKYTKKAVLASTIQSELTDVIAFLNKFQAANENLNIKNFRDNFYKQYEDNEVPLLEALDTETGVGYKGKDVNGVNALLDDLMIGGNAGNAQDLPWSKEQQFLLSKLFEALKNKEYTVKFTDEDIKEFSYTSDLPDTYPVMFRLLGNKILFQSCGGSSAANLLGRFAHGDKEIHAIINEITAYEQELKADKVLAEIVHLPESRIGNILLRPAIRNYEIPYLGKSALPADKQLLLQDLMVSVRGNKVILRSQRLGKEIIPRLGTAHNYSFNALPVYQFLCDMQTQYFDKPGLGMSWGVLSKNFKFLPRIEYKNVILSRAKWQLNKTDYEVLLDDKKENYTTLVNDWRTKWELPATVVLADSDNELFVNFEDKQSLRMLVSTISKRTQIVLEEALLGTDDLVIKDSKGNGYTNEFIGIIVKEKQTANDSDRKIKLQLQKPEVQQDFSIGSEWLYYKFYCGVKTADKFLTEVIKPLTEEIQHKQWADKFFFIRYADPDVHIRLRFHFTDTNHIGQVVTLVNKYVQPYFENGLITKIQTDTYKRELERYGANSIEIAERFFFIDSIATINMLDMIDEAEGEQIRWQFALRGLDELLDNFNIGTKQKLELLESLKEGFIVEHGGDKNLRVQLDMKYRNLKKDIDSIMDRSMDTGREIYPVIELLNWKKEQIQPLADELLELSKNEKLEVEIDNLLGSYVHMMLNRIFKARQRTFEMLVYDSLYRYYKSKQAREKAQNVSADKAEK